MHLFNGIAATVCALALLTGSAVAETTHPSPREVAWQCEPAPSGVVCEGAFGLSVPVPTLAEATETGFVVLDMINAASGATVRVWSALMPTETGFRPGYDIAAGTETGFRPVIELDWSCRVAMSAGSTAAPGVACSVPEVRIARVRR